MTMQSLSGKGDIATVGGLAVTLQPSAAKTTTNTSPNMCTVGVAHSLNAANYSGVVAYIIVTAVSGTGPSMTVKLQDSIDGANFADTGFASAAITATGVYPIRIPAGNLAEGAILQAVSTITGTTPSFTYSIVLAGVKR